MHTTVVLASASPSRLGLLRGAGISPVVQPSAVDEDAVVAQLPADLPEGQVVQALARAKAADVAERHGSRIAAGTGAERLLVIGCDSMLLHRGALLGKPHTVERAWQRWQDLRGQTATLLTGHHVVEIVADTVREVGDTSTTQVRFGSPADADLRAYLDTGEPLECAGAFTLESLGGWFIDGIDGDPSGVIGISLPLLRRLFDQLEVRVSQLWQRELIIN